jgi:hypothetical protein
MKMKTRSWEDGEDLDKAHRSYGGMEIDRSSWEKFGAENHHRTKNSIIALGGKGLEEVS